MSRATVPQLAAAASLLLLVVALTPSTAEAQAWTGSGRIQGRVVDTEGNPVEGAKVHYELAEDRSVSPPPFTTNTKGRFSHLGIRGGTWIAYAEKEGYHRSDEQLTEVYSTGVSDPVDLILERIPEEELRNRARYEAEQLLDEARDAVRAGDLDEATETYGRALEMLPEEDHPVVLAALAAIHINRQDLDQARQCLERSLAIDPDHVESLKAMANIAAFEGDLERADELVEKVPDDEPIHPNTLITMAMAHFNKGESDATKRLLERAIRDFPDNALAHYYLGISLLSLGEDVGVAKRELERSLELDPDHAEAASANEYLSYLQSPTSAEGQSEATAEGGTDSQ